MASSKEITAKEFVELVSGNKPVTIIADSYAKYGFNILFQDGTIIEIEASKDFDLPILEFTKK